MAQCEKGIGILLEFWYLGALRAASEMAEYLGEKDFANTCNRLFEQGSKWTDENLYNGEYYIQEIRPPEDPKSVSTYLTAGMGAKELSNPTFQLGKGCLVDQLVGQYMSHICDLGYLAQEDHIKTTLIITKPPWPTILTICVLMQWVMRLHC
jgi:uncharacterized protein (DUF608 family)